MLNKQPTPSATSKQIDKLYRSSNDIIFLIILGLFVPFLMVAFAILGLYHAIQKYQLLKKFDAGTLQVSEDEKHKIKLLSRRPIRFFVPLFIVVLWILTIAMLVTMGLIDVMKLIEYCFQ